MDKRSTFTSIIVGSVFLLILAQSAPADTRNGSFDSDLSEWDIPYGPDLVVWDAGTAYFKPDGSTTDSTLIQYDITVDLPLLTFDVFMETEPGGETDYFTASINNTVFYTLGSEDSRLIYDSVTNLLSLADPVTYDLTNFLGQTATLKFNLFHDYTESSTTTVRLDNVHLTPVPAAVVLGSIGLSFSGWLLKRKRMI